MKRQLGQSGRERESRAPLYSRKLSPPRPQPPKAATFLPAVCPHMALPLAVAGAVKAQAEKTQVRPI